MNFELFEIAQGLFKYMLVLSVQVLLILGLRKPIRKALGANTCYALWALPVLWLPFYSIDQAWMMWPSFIETSKDLSNGITLITSNYIPEVFQSNHSFSSRITLVEQTPSLSFTLLLSWLLLLIWINGVLLLTFRGLIRAKKFNKLLWQNAHSTAVPKEFTGQLDCLQVRGLHSPAIAGLWKPTLLLPEDFLDRFNTDQRYLVLAHEAVHAKRKDNLWNLIAEVFLILFWFNPIIHAAIRTFHLDQEVSCDALALRHCNKQQQQCFARTLLESAKYTNSLPHPVTIVGWNNLTQLKERSLMINHHIKRKIHPLLSVTFLGLLALSGASCTTSVRSAERDPYKIPSTTLTRSVYVTIKDVMDSREQNDYNLALEKLDSLKERHEAGSLNLYEMYMTWVFDAAINFDLENYDASLSSWNKVLTYAENEDQTAQALTRIGQIYLTQEEFYLALDPLLRAKSLMDEPSPNLEFQIATAYYQNDDFQSALPYAQSVLDIKGNDASRQDYIFLRHLYDNLSNQDKVEEISREMLLLFTNQE